MREFRQKASTGKTKVWKITQKKEEHTITWGLLDGKFQSTTDRPGSKGKEDTKAYKSPKEQCTLVVERLIKKKIEGGYVEYVSGKPLETRNETIDYLNLPKNMCFYKPQNTYDIKKAAKLDEQKKVLKTLKRDGMMHIASKDAGETMFFSRRMDDETEKHEELVDIISGFIPDKTILLGELVLEDADGGDDFLGLSSIVRSKKDKSLDKQKELGKPIYYIWDVAFWKGQDWVNTKTAEERIEFIQEQFSDVSDRIQPIVTYSESIAELIKKLKAEGREGLVVTIKDQKLGVKGYTFDGKAARPGSIFKVKPSFEDDFIVRWDPDNGIGEYGTGKNQGLVRSVALFKMNDDGTERYICNCGTGFSEAERIKYSGGGKFPTVFEIKYDMVQDSGSLRFPVFLRERLDKAMDECI